MVGSWGIDLPPLLYLILHATGLQIFDEMRSLGPGNKIREVEDGISVNDEGWWVCELWREVSGRRGGDERELWNGCDERREEGLQMRSWRRFRRRVVFRLGFLFGLGRNLERRDLGDKKNLRC